MQLPEYLYLYPLVGSVLMVLLGALKLKPRKIKVEDVSLIYNGVDKPFDNVMSNTLYKWSYQKPFV